jgi:hypothetical protein
MNFNCLLLDLDYRSKRFPVSGRMAGIRLLMTEGMFRERKSASYFRFGRKIPFPMSIKGSSAILELFRLPRQITRPYRPVA